MNNPFLIVVLICAHSWCEHLLQVEGFYVNVQVNMCFNILHDCRKFGDYFEVGSKIVPSLAGNQ